MISARMKAALVAAKARGTKLGDSRGGPKVDPACGRAARTRAANDFARRVGPMALAAWQKAGGYGQAATMLASRGIRTPRGGQWTRAAVRSLILRHQAQLPAQAMHYQPGHPVPQATL